MAVTLDLPGSREYQRLLDMAFSGANQAWAGMGSELDRQGGFEDDLYNRAMADLDARWDMETSPMQQAAMMRAMSSGGDLNPAMKNAWLRERQASGRGYWGAMRGLQGDRSGRMAGYSRDLGMGKMNSMASAAQAAQQKAQWGARRKPSTWNQIANAGMQLGGIALGAGLGGAPGMAASAMMPGMNMGMNEGMEAMDIAPRQMPLRPTSQGPNPLDYGASTYNQLPSGAPFNPNAPPSAKYRTVRR